MVFVLFAVSTLWRRRPASFSPAMSFTSYVGTYRNKYLGTAMVVEEHDSLMLKLGPHGTRSYALKHFDRDLFTYFPYEETPDVPSGVIFQIGPDQKASQMTIGNLNDDGQGILGRVEDN
jgi:hypothetical protein